MVVGPEVKSGGSLGTLSVAMLQYDVHSCCQDNGCFMLVCVHYQQRGGRHPLNFSEYMNTCLFDPGEYILLLDKLIFTLLGRILGKHGY